MLMSPLRGLSDPIRIKIRSRSPELRVQDLHMLTCEYGLTCYTQTSPSSRHPSSCSVMLAKVVSVWPYNSNVERACQNEEHRQFLIGKVQQRENNAVSTLAVCNGGQVFGSISIKCAATALDFSQQAEDNQLSSPPSKTSSRLSYRNNATSRNHSRRCRNSRLRRPGPNQLLLRLQLPELSGPSFPGLLFDHRVCGHLCIHANSCTFVNITMIVALPAQSPPYGSHQSKWSVAAPAVL
jgi:hypothetical protein